MTLNIDDIDFRIDMPDIPRTAPAVRVRAPGFEDRAPGMKALAERLRLGETRHVETQHGLSMVSKSGEVEYLSGAGAVWSVNLAASQDHDNELRKWPELEKSEDEHGEPVLTLGGGAKSRAMELAREMAETGGFDLKYAGEPTVSLMRVAELSEKGETLREGAGEATMSFAYSIEGLPVLGAGAKTMIDADPDGRDGLRATSAINVWRNPEGTEKVEVGGTEAVLAAGLLEDADLNLAAEKGGRITIETARFGLMALPATMRQGILFPVLEVSGRVDQADEHHYNFGRICPAATMKTYASVGLYADYLAGRN